jgi:uncharacterized membrane protein YciS (DUF1049 family)
MPAARKYFQDKVVLSLVSLNLFLAVLVVIVVALRLGSNAGEGYIVQYRSNLGIGAFKTGSMADFVYIIIFAVLAAGFHVFMSFKTYRIRRQLAVAVLGMGGLLLVLALIISNALLVLR